MKYQDAKLNHSGNPSSTPDSPRKIAFQSIILMGVVSLLGDITYQGVRSIAGPFLSGLGASTAVMGIHETIMRAAVAGLTGIAQRGMA